MAFPWLFKISFEWLGNSGGGSKSKVGGGHMASAEREPIRGSGGGAPSGVQGQSPWSEGQGGPSPLQLKGF